MGFRYGESFPVSAEVLDSSFCLPIGKAKVFCNHLNFTELVIRMVNFLIFSTFCFQQIEKEGKDVTITAFSKMVGLALKVCPAFAFCCLRCYILSLPIGMCFLEECIYLWFALFLRNSFSDRSPFKCCFGHYTEI